MHGTPNDRSNVFNGDKSLNGTIDATSITYIRLQLQHDVPRKAHKMQFNRTNSTKTIHIEFISHWEYTFADFLTAHPKFIHVFHREMEDAAAWFNLNRTNET